MINIIQGQLLLYFPYCQNAPLVKADTLTYLVVKTRGELFALIILYFTIRKKNNSCLKTSILKLEVSESM